MRFKNLKLNHWLVLVLLSLATFRVAKADGDGLVVVDSIDLEEVVITASRLNSKLKNIPQKIEVITADEIRSVPNATLAEVLKRITNLDIIQYPGLSAKIGIRGFSPSAHSRSYTLILINGKPSGTRNLAFISANNIERVEIVKGPYATLYGSDAMGGVINIITKTISDELGGAFSLGTGSFKYSEIEATLSGKLIKGLNFNLGYSRKKQGKDYEIGNNNFLSVSEKQKIILDSNSYGSRMENSQYELHNLNSGLQTSLNKTWSANAMATYTFANGAETPGDFFGYSLPSIKDLNRLNIYTELERKKGNNTLIFSPYFTSEKNANYSDNTDSGFVNFKDNVKEYGFQLQDVQGFGNAKLILGVDYGVYDYQSERFSDETTPEAPYKPNNKNENIAVFAQLAYHTPKLDINGGVRYDHYSYAIDANKDLNAKAADENYNALNASIGGQCRILDNLKFHTSFGTAFSVPDAYKVAGQYEISSYFPDWDYWYVKSFVGNPDLKPEKSLTIDFGLGYSALKRALNMDVTYFNTTHKDKIVEKDLESGKTSFINADKSKMEGLELTASFDLGTFAKRRFKLELYSNWTFMFKSELELKKDDGTREFKDMRYVRKSNGNSGLNFNNLKGLTSRLNARYSGVRLENDGFAKYREKWSSNDYYTEKDYTPEDKMIEHAGSLVFDYSLSYRFKNGISVGGSVNNLMDENYTEKDGYNMPGRSFLAKISYQF